MISPLFNVLETHTNIFKILCQKNLRERNEPYQINSMLESNEDPSQNMTQDRIHALDNLRAASMLLVIFGHSAMSFVTIKINEISWPIQDIYTHKAFDVFVIIAHTFVMPIFFFVAGYLGRTLYIKIGFHAFVEHKLKKIILPLLAGMVTIVPLIHLSALYGRLITTSHATEPNVLKTIYDYFLSETFFSSYNSAHLWFLWYLVLFYFLTILVVCYTPRFLNTTMMRRVDNALEHITSSALKPLVCIIPTISILYLMRVWGPDTPTSILPEIRFILLYGLFFSIGWLLERRQEHLRNLTKYIHEYMVIAIICIPIYLTGFGLQYQTDHPNYVMIKFITLSLYASIMWLLFFSVIGLFVKRMNFQNTTMRYISESSYWLYFIHVPIIIFIQILIAPMVLPIFIKFGLTVVISLLLMLTSYQCLVRHTSLNTIFGSAKQKRIGNATAADTL